MNAVLVCLAVCAVTAAPPAGTLLQYEGQIVADRDEGVGRKAIGYDVLVAEADGKQMRLLWAVSEKGQGNWPWVEQFGSVTVNDTGAVVRGRPASVLYEHGEGLSPVPLVPPVFGGPKPLADGATWRQGRLQHHVRTPEDKNNAKQFWQVEIATAIGRQRILLVDKDRQIVNDVDETVFMGPGKKHRLSLALVKETELKDDALKQAVAAFDALLTLREELDYELQGGRVQWNPAQLAKLKDELPDILDKTDGTPLENVALRAGGDAKLQKGIAAAIEKLREQFVGEPAPKFDLPAATLSGKALKSADVQGKPLVLHVWDYRDNPLVEPYGQIGYLDFLYRKHKEDGVQVFGIAVDERLDRPDTRSEAVRSVRKLQSFMNVGYPIVLGGRNVLAELGDPERFGADLPLVVVVGADGKITHYHTGLYEVDNENGLAELDAAVKKLK